MRKNNYYIITGGPGVGKTTLIQALCDKGYHIVAEDARKIIKRELTLKGNGVPWKNKIRYTQLMLEASVNSYASLPKNDQTIYFFDRGILDAICYAKMINLNITTAMDNLVINHLYNLKVFILPPWFSIYKNDNERKQSWEEAVDTFEILKKTYTDYGYELLEVPLGTVEERVAYILEQI